MGADVSSKECKNISKISKINFTFSQNLVFKKSTGGWRIHLVTSIWHSTPTISEMIWSLRLSKILSQSFPKLPNIERFLFKIKFLCVVRLNFLSLFFYFFQNLINIPICVCCEPVLCRLVLQLDYKYLDFHIFFYHLIDFYGPKK